MNVLDHNLSPYLGKLSQANSSEELKRLPEYREIEPEVRRILSSVLQQNHVKAAPIDSGPIRVSGWNVERGTHLEGSSDTLKSHSIMRENDVYVLTELDYGMARSQNRRVPEELADALDDIARDVALIEPNPVDWGGWVTYLLVQMEGEAG